MEDVIVIGSGPAGMTAALYASRSNLNTMLIEKYIPGGQMMNTAEIENYPGVGLVSGEKLSDNMFKDTMNYGTRYEYGDVLSVEDCGWYKKVITDSGIHESKTVVLATGSKHRKLNVPGENEYAGRGVSYCAVCDGAFFKDDKVVVVGGGDAAIEEAIYLTQFAKEVIVIHRRDTLRAQQIVQERAFANEKISFIWNSEVKEIVGNDGVVESVIFKDNKSNTFSSIHTNGVFIYVGLDPVSKPFERLDILDSTGWVLTNEKMETSIPGIFAVGDIRSKELRQIATAVGDGSIAGQGVYNYIESRPL